MTFDNDLKLSEGETMAIRCLLLARARPSEGFSMAIMLSEGEAIASRWDLLSMVRQGFAYVFF